MTKEELEKEAEEYANGKGHEHYNYLFEENAELKDELKKWKDEWQEQVQNATDEGYTRTLQTIQLTKAKELLKQWLQTSKASGCDNINIVTDTEQFLNSEVESAKKKPFNNYHSKEEQELNLHNALTDYCDM